MDVAQTVTKKLTVTFTDGRDPVETKITPRAQVTAERHFSCSIAAMDHAEQIYYMVWASLHYSAREPRDFDSFLDVLNDIEPVKEDEQSDDPIPGDPQLDSSSS
jgi:hypothetical protein